jgi:uncharacterized protein (DUF2141 family)
LRTLLLALMAVALQGQTSTSVIGTGVIEGYVVRARTESASPLVDARLELNDSRVVTRTDSSGRFVFSGLPPGRYRLRVTKDGFVRQEYPHSAMDAPGTPIDLVAGQQIRNVLFKLDTAPTISGVIRDQNNSVVAGVIVQAMRRGFNARGNRIVTLIASTRTDDRGFYRLYWLDPGEYVIAAVPDVSANQPSGRPNGPTYFPGFAELGDARVIRMDTRDANGIDFRLVQHDPTTVWGITTSVTTGSPVAAEISLKPPEDSVGVAQYQTKSRSQDGGYSLGGVAAGTYIFSAKTKTESFATRIIVRPPTPFSTPTLRVNAELNPGVEVAGRAMFTSDPAIDIRRARVQLAETQSSLPDPEPAALAQDGNFVFRAVQPGVYALSVTDLPNDFYLKAAIQAGADVLEKLIPVGWGPQNMLGPLEIQIGTDGGRITGAVFDRANIPSAGALITLVPEGDARLRLDRYRTVLSASDGSFTIRGIVPGDYRLFGWDELEPNAYLNVDFMRAYLGLGTPVRIQPGQSASISLRLIESDR